jgi:hypothetical protein
MKPSTLLVAAGVVLGGCGAAAPVPADKLARAQESLRRAEDMPEVAADPTSAMHLTLAKNQMQYAKKLMVDGHNEDARWVLMRAESDGEAALYLAHAEAARADAQKTIDAIRQAMALMQQGGS